MPDLFPEAPPAVSIDDQIRCVEREIEWRLHVYPRLIARGRMTQERANREVVKMRAVLWTLRKSKHGGGRQVL